MTVQQVEIDPQFWRSTWDNVLVENLSQGVISGSVTHDTSRATHWALDVSMTYDGWLELTPFVDWVSPILKLNYPDGTTVVKQLGHYLVLDSPEQREELGGTVRLDARDALWLINAQGLLAQLQVTGGDFGALANTILDQVVVAGGLPTTKLRRTVPAIPIPVQPLNYRGFPLNERLLKVINELFATGAYYPLYTTETGGVGTHLHTALYNTAPVRSWYANPPSGLQYIGQDLVDLTPFVGQPSPVIGAVDTSPGSADLVNEVIVTGGIGTAASVRGSALLSQFSSGSQSIVSGSSQTVTVPLVPNATIANAIAKNILEEMLTENTTISLTVKPDPAFVAIHAPVRLGIWDLLGRKVAVGKYLVKRVKYGMTVDDALMRVDLGSLEDAVPV